MKVVKMFFDEKAYLLSIKPYKMNLMQINAC